MMKAPKKLLLDTNVWLDYFADRRRPRGDAVRLVQEAAALDAALYCTALAMKDVFFVHSQDMKRALRADGIVVDERWSAAVRESAWSCVRAMSELALVVPVGQADALQAMALRPLCDDFEDDLVLAAAQRIQADYLITSDKQLARSAPAPCLDVPDMLALLQAAKADGDGGDTLPTGSKYF